MADIFNVQAKLDAVRGKIEINGQIIDKLVNEIVDKYTKDLTELIDTVKNCVMSPTELCVEELESIALKIPILQYSVASNMEKIGCRVDLSKSFEKDKYSTIYQSVSGTVKDKDFMATQESYSEYVMTVVMNRSYKQVQQKMQCASDLLGSIKKILTRKLQEYQIPEN